MSVMHRETVFELCQIINHTSSTNFETGTCTVMTSFFPYRHWNL